MVVARWVVGILLNMIAVWALCKFAYEAAMVFWGFGETDAGRLVRSPIARIWYFLLLVVMDIAGYVIIGDWIYCAVSVAITLFFLRRHQLIALNVVTERMMKGLLEAGMTVEDAKVVAADALKAISASRKFE